MAGPAYKLICPKCYRPVQQADLYCQGCAQARDPGGWAADPYLGKVIAGKYRIVSRVGAGGMGAVFLASHFFGETTLGEVVIKFLLSEHVHDPERRARFLKEARAARELHSPHVVKIFDFGEDEDGIPYLVMEYLQGRSLFKVMTDAGRLPARRALHIASQVAEAMAEGHQRGILHRDLKPENIMLLDARGGDFVKILDFGIARVPQAGSTGGHGAKSLVSSLMIGTPRYMAPELIAPAGPAHSGIDGRVDIFALGVIVFELLCGCLPIPLRSGDNEMAYVTLNVTEAPRKVSEMLPGTPPELDALVARMMAKRAADRPESMADVVQAIEALLQLPALQPDRFSAETVGVSDSVSRLLLPPPPRPASALQRSVHTTLAVLRTRGYFMSALLGVVIALAALVLWLLSRDQQYERLLHEHDPPAPLVSPAVAIPTVEPILPAPLPQAIPQATKVEEISPNNRFHNAPDLGTFVAPTERQDPTTGSRRPNGPTKRALDPAGGPGRRLRRTPRGSGSTRG